MASFSLDPHCLGFLNKSFNFFWEITEGVVTCCAWLKKRAGKSNHSLLRGSINPPVFNFTPNTYTWYLAQLWAFHRCSRLYWLISCWYPLSLLGHRFSPSSHLLTENSYCYSTHGPSSNILLKPFFPSCSASHPSCLLGCMILYPLAITLVGFKGREDPRVNLPCLTRKQVNFLMGSVIIFLL